MNGMDFAVVAAAISRADLDEGSAVDLVRELCTTFTYNNPYFDAHRFISDCRLTQDEKVKVAKALRLKTQELP